MDKTEALDFIGLKEPLTEESVLNKYTERFNYYHMLYMNAPNKAIEKIQQQNLEKLKQVKTLLLEDVAARKKAFEKKFPDAAPKPKPETREPKEKLPVGWLIVHTENRNAETFPLFEGINYIGRKKKEDAPNNIVIEDDLFVSRTHAFIKAKRMDGRLRFELYDGDGSKPSANGIFLNGDETKIQEHCSLSENDTIQIGTTKLVFKKKKEERSITGEIEDVMRTDFIRTVDVKRR